MADRRINDKHCETLSRKKERKMLNVSSNVTAPTSTELCDKETEGEMIAHSVFLSVVMVFTLFGNFLVIGTVVTYEKLRTVTNYFVISLAVSDVLVGLITLPLKASFEILYKSQIIFSNDEALIDGY